MERIAKLPPAFKRFEKMGGVLDFAAFDNSNGTHEQVVLAIPEALPRGCTFDGESLKALGDRRINERVFFGDWYDPETGKLLSLGSFTTADGSKLQNPTLEELDGANIKSVASPCPDAGSGGQFAYAFSHPPHSLRGRPREVQAVFTEIRDFILPPNEPSEISDWTSPQLPEVSDYFAAGMEWWGVFLFSIHIPALERLTIIAGSTTD